MFNQSFLLNFIRFFLKLLKIIYKFYIYKKKKLK
jgi:hypothetical protein